MSGPGLLQLHLEQALLLGLGWLAFWTAWRSAVRSPRSVPAAGSWRRAAAAVMAAAFLLPPATRLLPRRPGPAAPSPGAVSGAAAMSVDAGAPWRGRGVLSPPQYRVRFSAAVETAAGVLVGLAALVALVALARLAARRRALGAFLAGLPVVRRHRRVTVCASDVATVPFAARADGRAWVVVPTDLLDDAASLRMLLAHELQHHRQRDLQALAVLDTLRALVPWNPALGAWKRLMEELQELGCDEAVMRGGGGGRAYAELLLRAATTRGRRRFVPRGVTAAGGGSAGMLKRRISMLMRRSGGAVRRTRGAKVAAGVCLALLGLAAVGARSAVVEKKLEAAEVQLLAEKLGRRGVAVPVSDLLVAEVNRWLATSRDRAFLREARRRLDERRVMVDAAFARHQVPAALAAVAIVESGFRNLEPKPGVQGAGIWQFIPATARRFGLAVDGERDERMDVERQTEAAARYLAALHAQLDDWPLALAGYAEGGRKVQDAIEQGRTRDAWELMRAGRLGRYAATVTAAALVLEGDAGLLE